MRIGVLCSGGDAPGMNPCLRAVVRSALDAGHEVVGIRRGYQGILDADFFLDEQHQSRMPIQAVFHLAKRGGTILHSSRSEQFRTFDGLQRACENLRENRIDALIPIGGDGTIRGAMALSE